MTTEVQHKSPTQKEMVLAHLQTYKSIEPLQALRDYGCYRLGAVIGVLREEGHNIKTETQHATSRITGRPVKFAKYIYYEKN